jgi:penicillin-binding protein 1A
MTKSNTPKVATIINNSSSIIYDSDGMNITTLNLVNNNSVQYDDLPDVFINALISAEDARFFEHSGVDFQRILSAIINNISTNSTQGASTLTQQLIKNIYLDPSKTLERKISEIIMALNLESKMTKEDILLAYVNNIMFDGVTIGVNSASLKLFSKPINNVNLAEAALLAGLVNAPSYYNPIKNPVNAKDRMDTVLSLMYRHNYITDTQLNDARKVQISDLINLSEYKETTYPYQSYLDIVYNEVIELTGYNPLTTPLIIETYMDTDLQALIDSIQNNEDSTIKFTDDNQQIAISVVDNKNGALVAAGGGRNYAGQLLFNRATDMKNQPASTMKPLLSYALAVEHLGWNNKQVLKDEPYSYSGSNLNVNNVDHTYMGEILIEEAIGYSRNTTALTTLEKVINKVGINTVTDYLKSINLLDVSSDKFNLSYGLGAMHHGISPTQLASAYSMLARDGYFTPAYTVKRIIAQETNKVIYTHKQEEKQVLSKETAFIISDILKSVVNNNYYNLGTVKIDNVEMHAKTGTSSFDGNLLKELGYPMDASKDIWMAGYSADYTTVVWSGFDYPVKGEENYFKSGSDARKYIPRKAFTKIMNYQSKKGEKISLPSTLSPIQIVKGTNLLPDEYTPRKLITTAYYKKGDEPTETISPPKLDDVSRLDLLLIGNTLHISFKDDLFDIVDVTSQKQIIDYSSIYGNIEYVVETINQNGITNTFTSNNSSFSFNLNDSGFLKIKAYTRYAYIKNITSNIYETNYYSLFTF